MSSHLAREILSITSFVLTTRCLEALMGGGPRILIAVGGHGGMQPRCAWYNCCAQVGDGHDRRACGPA
jgi:uncharacterized protein YodC (DUF2158 family)